VPGLFVPGFGAAPGLYGGGLPTGWTELEPPAYGLTGGAVARYVDWLAGELDARGPVALGGHSFGAALAVLAAAARPDRVERLVLVAPAGLPLVKPMRASAADFVVQVCRGWYPLRQAAVGVSRVARAPRAALRLAREIYALDLRAELASLRHAGVPCTVVAAVTDTLTPTGHCRRLAELAGGEYRELIVTGGHVWFLRSPALHRRHLAL